MIVAGHDDRMMKILFIIVRDRTTISMIVRSSYNDRTTMIVRSIVQR
eukprot:UN10275